MIKFNVITMKDGEINIEEKKELSKSLTDKFIKEKGQPDNKGRVWVDTDDIKEHETLREEKLIKRNMEKEIPFIFFKNSSNKEFFTQTLETMSKIITDESKLWYINDKISKGFTWGTFRRYKTKQPRLVKSYKTFKGAKNNTYWRNQ